jgi:hypothetical protein
MFVGIGPTSGQRPIHYAIVDGDLKAQALEATDLEGMLAFIAGLESPVVAIGSPQGPNREQMKRPQIRRRFNLRPDGETWAKWRVGEYELRRRNIRMYNTPSNKKDAPGWIQTGYELYGRLSKLGFEFIQPQHQAQPRSMLEVLPHACYSVLLERRPFLKSTLEGRLQRQLVLFLEGMSVPNPTEILEMIGQDHLLSGHLPIDSLYSPEQLDTLIAAYTAFLAVTKPERISQVGDPKEGWITLPTADLRDFYI